jgi:hypothetical protein
VLAKACYVFIKKEANPELADEMKSSFFDHERLFFWLEVLGLINALSSAIPTLLLFAKWLKVSTWLLSVRLHAQLRTIAIAGS